MGVDFPLLPTIRSLLLQFLVCLSFSVHCGPGNAQPATISQTSPTPQSRTRSITWITSFLTSQSKWKLLELIANEQKVAMRAVDISNYTESEIDRWRSNPPALIVIDAAHSSIGMKIESILGPMLAASDTPYILIGDYDSTVAKKSPAGWQMATERGVDSVLAQRVREYFRFGGSQNTRMLISALSQDTTEELADPTPFPSQGYYHPTWNTILSESDQVAPLLAELREDCCDEHPLETGATMPDDVSRSSLTSPTGCRQVFSFQPLLTRWAVFLDSLFC
jgi:cobalamin biosynthesis Mg chelatase CobN